MKKLILLICAIALASALFPLSAQTLKGSIDFDFKFDNKEYDHTANGISETNFGVRLTPQIGFGWRHGNSLMVGTDIMNHFGADTQFDHQMICYYSYTDDHFGVFLGRFPRRNMIGLYTKALFSDYVTYYDSNLDGLMAHYRGQRGYAELVFDWDSMIAGPVREKFMIFSAGRLNASAFYCGYNASMYHHAGSEEVRGVVDNILLYPFAGVDFTRYIDGLKALYLQAGWLQTFQNDRNYIGQYVTPGGIQIDARIQWHGFGLYNALYLGGNLMPYYDSTVLGQPAYGSGLYKGDPFYRTDNGIYNRLELYWQQSFKSGLAVTIASVHHYDGTGWGWEQKIEARLILGGNSHRFRRPQTRRLIEPHPHRPIVSRPQGLGQAAED